MPICFTAHHLELEKRKTPNEPNFRTQHQEKAATSAPKNEPNFTPQTDPSHRGQSYPFHPLHLWPISFLLP